MSDFCATGILFGSFCETDGVKYVVKLVRVGRYVRTRREDGKEIVEIMGEVPAVQRLKYPMERLRKEVEYSRCRTQTEWKEHIDVVLAVPLEYQQPVISLTNGDMTEGRFEIPLHHNCATTRLGN